MLLLRKATSKGASRKFAKNSHTSARAGNKSSALAYARYCQGKLELKQSLASTNHFTHCAWLHLLQELSNLGVAPKPVLRHDLRILTDGKQAQQEFDVVLLCGADRVVLGEHKSHLSSKNGVEELVKKAAIVRKLAKDGPEMYAPFRNKKLGLAFMAESIAVSAEQSVKKACKREGVALFRRSGAAVRLARSGVPPGRGIMRFA